MKTPIDVECLDGLLDDPTYESKVVRLVSLLREHELEDFVPEVSSRWNLLPDKHPALGDICGHLLRHVTPRFFNSDAYILDVKLLRHHASQVVKVQEGAFLWHSDNHPATVLNIIVYLTDVGPRDGGMQYAKKGGEVLKRPYSKPYGGKNLETEMNSISFAGDLSIETLLGPRGTAFAFDNCIIHRASRPENSNRDALLLQLGTKRELLRRKRHDALKPVALWMSQSALRMKSLYQKTRHGIDLSGSISE